MEKLIKIKIKSIFGKVLFEYESKENSIKKTLCEAIKGGANLSGANLSGADLSGADLRRADLTRANLSDAENKDNAYIPIFCKWTVSIIGDKIKIGCKEKTIEEWDSFFASNEEFDTKRGTEEFNQIEDMYLAYKAYFQHLNKKK